MIATTHQGGTPLFPFSTIVHSASVSFRECPFSTPLILSHATIHTITEATATVEVEVDGHRATGRGAIYLSDLWAWPDPSLSHEDRDARLRSLCESLASDLYTHCGGEPAHPLELGLRLHSAAIALADIPALASGMCASPFDAAIHDAVGNALGVSAFALYQTPVPLPSADPYFRGSACEAIAALLVQPTRRLPAWYIAGKNDGAAELRPWIVDRGYRAIKLKLLGKDATADARRTAEVYRLARQMANAEIQLSVDSNEGNPTVESVVDYLEALQALDADAFRALAYLEQPTSRDIRQHPVDWRPATALRPVLLDEGLVSLHELDLALEQGWSGLALKTCKGHSFALTAAAWAQEHGMLLSIQDLTNSGLAMIHAAWFAAHVPNINGVELNSPQFTPAANAEILPHFPELVSPTNGYHILPETVPTGLGATIPTT